MAIDDPPACCRQADKEVSVRYNRPSKMSSHGPNEPKLMTGSARTMVKRINFGDDIFFLAMKIKHLEYAAKLELSPALFRDNIAAELEFIFAALQKIYASLKKSSLVISRGEYIKNLLRLMHSFTTLLDDITTGEAGYSAMIADRREAVSESRRAIEPAIEEIQGLLSQYDEASEEGKDLISEEEYRHLLSEETD